MFLDEFGVDYWEKYIQDESYDAYIPRPGCPMSEEEIQAWTQRAYARFYTRPLFALRAGSRAKSWHEFRRSAETAWQMLVSRPEGQHYQEMDLS